MAFETSDKDREKRKNKLVVVNRELCPGTHHCKCVDVCPTGALTQEGTEPPTVDGVQCIRCGNCVDACGSGAIVMQDLSLDFVF